MHKPVQLIRAEGEEKPSRIEGEAVRFNEWTTIGGGYWGFDEKVDPGAFDKVLEGEHDVRALINHDPNLLCARSKNGTLKLTKTSTGLSFGFDVPDRQFARDYADAISTGDMDGCSFGFTIVRQEWTFANDENGLERDQRVILEVGELYDVGPVTYPAYANTSVSARSKKAYEEAKENQTSGNRAKAMAEARGRTISIIKSKRP